MEYRNNTSSADLYQIEAEARRLRAQAVREAFAGLGHRIVALFSSVAHRAA